ncbi:MAG: hypothetical protein JOZ17_24070, partial [Acetobacteraceae bacterium]|nr:hypothetical protein [Acetobacteraceae bacterium]
MTHNLRYVLTCVVVLLARPTLAQQPEPALAERHARSEVIFAASQDRADDLPADAGTTRGGVQGLTPAQMQADFDLMRHALEEAHPGLYRYSTKAQMDREFDAQRGKLSRPMSREQFEVVVAQTLA